MTTDYLKRYCGQTLEIKEDVADRNQDGLMGWRKAQGNRVVEIGWIEVAGDICLRRPRPTQGCRTDDDDFPFRYHIKHIKSSNLCSRPVHDVLYSRILCKFCNPVDQNPSSKIERSRSCSRNSVPFMGSYVPLRCSQEPISIKTDAALGRSRIKCYGRNC